MAFDLVVVGAGPGGYVAAIRASQLGMKVAVVEKEHLGGICLNWGCIPTKALLKSAELYSSMKSANKFGLKAENIDFDFSAIIRRSRQIASRMSKGVAFLFKKNNIMTFVGSAKLIDAKTVAVVKDDEQIAELTGAKVLIATGARPRSIPGIEIDHQKIITSREAMSLENLPASLIVIGAGAIGVEFAYFYQTLGCQVALVEMLPHLLPVEDEEISQQLERSFKKQKVKIFTESLVKNVKVGADDVVVSIEKNGEIVELRAEMALMAIGVQGNVENIGLEDVGVKTERSFIPVDEFYRTNVESIYAIGDVVGPPWLAHVASAEGIRAVEKMAGKDVAAVNYDAIPGCTYCQPQIASIGLTEKAAAEKGFAVKIGRFPFVANGRSLAAGESEGMVKLIYDKKTEKLLGAHVIHAEATELIGELSVIKSLGVAGHDLINTVHAHPTLSESIMEAAAAAFGEAIHV
ncbi:MAG: dihydrolipoyl dehydrogenase [Calditrichaeota bacterium]|nr:dihydrolipoyl dehydrogenase [Calditrichota bacterium]